MEISKNMIEALNLILGNDFRVRMSESLNAFHFFNRNGKPCVGTINGHSMLIIMQKDGKPFKSDFNIDACDFLDPADLEIENIGNHKPQCGCDIQQPLKMYEQENNTDNFFNLPIHIIAQFNKISKILKAIPVLKRVNDCTFGFFEMGNYCAIMLVMGFTMRAESKEDFENNLDGIVDIKNTTPEIVASANEDVATPEISTENSTIENIKNGNRKSKNDCTKQNSQFIEAITAENDLEIAEGFCNKHFGFDCELIANSKTQFRISDGINEIPGYRLIRSGRQWQIRKLNEVMEQVNKHSENTTQVESEVAPMPKKTATSLTRKQKMIIKRLIDSGWKFDLAQKNLTKNIENEKEKKYYEVSIINNCFYLKWKPIIECDFNKSSANYICSYINVMAQEDFNAYATLKNRKNILYNEVQNMEPIQEKIAEIFSELEKLGWEKTDSDKFLERNFKGGFKGTINPAGNRIFHIATHKNEICLQFGWDNLFVTEILADIDAKKFAISFNEKIIEYARETGNYADSETLDGVIEKPEKPDLKKFLALPEYTRPLEYLPVSEKSEKAQEILYTAKRMRTLKVYITKIYGNGAIPIKQGKNWRIFTDKGHIPCVYLKKSNNIFILYKEAGECEYAQPKKADLKSFLAMPEYIRPMDCLLEDKPQTKNSDPYIIPDKQLAKQTFESITPPCTKAAIIARFYERDRYHDSVLKREVLLGFSKHTRDLFPEMRKFAALYGPTADLAKNGIEYRQKWSMGKGYFLANEDDREGWNIKKLPLHIVSNYNRIDFAMFADKLDMPHDPALHDRPQGRIEPKETPESVPEKPDKSPQGLKNREVHKRTWVYPEKTQISSFYNSPCGSAAYTVPIAPRLKNMQEARAFMKIMTMKPPEKPNFKVTRRPLDDHIKMLL